MKMIDSKLLHKTSSLAQALVILTLFALLSSCASNSASHLPSVFDLPSAVGGVFENARYNAKRRKVEAYVAQHYLALRQDAINGGGPAIEGALDVASVKAAKRDKPRNELVTNQPLYFYNEGNVVNGLINHFAALYEVKQTDKRMNGFSYTEVRQIILELAKQNFEPLRLSIQQGQGAALEQLASKLNISSKQKREQFYKKAQSSYQRIYLDLIVVVLMIHS